MARGHRRRSAGRRRASGGLSAFGQPLPATSRAPLLTALAALTTAALVLFVLPPGGDLAAHLYQRGFFIQHGFSFWNNYWYAGRYSFVTYSIGFYPLAALLGIKAVSLAAVAVAAAVFSRRRSRGSGATTARWPTRAFAVVWPLILISGELPFLVGMAFAISAVLAVQARRFWLFTAARALDVVDEPARAPLPGLFAAARRSRTGTRGADRSLCSAVAVSAGIEGLLMLLFPSGGRFPFSLVELLPVDGVLHRRARRHVEARAGQAAGGILRALPDCQPRILRRFHPRSARTSGDCATSHCRSRCWSAPYGSWRPRGLTVLALALVACWNLTPLAWSLDHNVSDPTSQPRFWAATVGAAAKPPDPRLSRRAGRHRRALGRLLPRPRRDPARAGLVSAGRLPSELGPLRTR